MTASGTMPVFDGHNDVLLRLEGRNQSFFDRAGEGHIDLPRAREGGLAGGFMAMFVPSEPLPEDVQTLTLNDRPVPPTPPLEHAQSVVLDLMGRLVRIERESDGSVQVIRSAEEIERCIATGVFAALMHVEGAEAIDPQFYALEGFHATGLRSLGFVWSRPNLFGEGVPFRFPQSPDTGPGLTDAGKELVRACNRLGVMIDLSHLNERGFWDVASISDKPLVATHSNAHAITPTTRNLTDRQLDAIRDSDGMVGVNFAVYFLRPDGTGEADTPLEVVVRHFDYLVERVGIDRVGFGSDFDGATVPAEIGDVSGLPRLIDALRAAGYDDAALRKLTHENWIRVLRATWGE
jgi:membrane dipeptidase